MGMNAIAESKMSNSFSDMAKAKKLREYFAQHGRIYIVVDASAKDVRVPEHLKGDPALRLVLNVRMPQPIYFRENALESDFSFGGQIFPTRIPMHAIWAAYVPEQSIDNGILWENDVPDGIRSVVKAVRNLQGKKEAEEAASAAAPESEKKAPVAKGRRVQHLRVIK